MKRFSKKRVMYGVFFFFLVGWRLWGVDKNRWMMIFFFGETTLFLIRFFFVLFAIWMTISGSGCVWFSMESVFGYAILCSVPCFGGGGGENPFSVFVENRKNQRESTFQRFWSAPKLIRQARPEKGMCEDTYGPSLRTYPSPVLLVGVVSERSGTLERAFQPTRTYPFHLMIIDPFHAVSTGVKYSACAALAGTRLLST